MPRCLRRVPSISASGEIVFALQQTNAMSGQAKLDDPDKPPPDSFRLETGLRKKSYSNKKSDFDPIQSHRIKVEATISPCRHRDRRYCPERTRSKKFAALEFEHDFFENRFPPFGIMRYGRKPSKIIWSA